MADIKAIAPRAIPSIQKTKLHCQRRGNQKLGHSWTWENEKTGRRWERRSQAGKHRWWWSCGPQKLPFVAMIMEIRRRCPTYGKVWWKSEIFWNLVNLKEKEKWSRRKWRKKIMRHGSMTWQSFTTIGLNQWLILELLHPLQYPRYCMGCESQQSQLCAQL